MLLSRPACSGFLKAPRTQHFSGSLLRFSAVHFVHRMEHQGIEMKKPSPLLVFDFDHSLIDCNSDPWVVEHLGAADTMLALRSVVTSWTDLMDRMMTELKSRGNSIDNIKDALRKIPLHPAMARAIQSAHSQGWELQIVSDANMFFIQTFLSHHNLQQCFTQIHSNPAHVDEQGVLRIRPYHSGMPHACSKCPSNMCKGLILDKIKQSTKFQNRQTIYVGDGRGDYCPSLRLQEGDHVLAREGYSLLKLLTENSHLVKAKIHSWKTPLDIESYLSQLV